MSNAIKYWVLRLLGHSLALAPVIYETLAVLPYGEADSFLDKLKLTGSAAVVIAFVCFCLFKNVLKERIKSPSPWMVACASFIVTAAMRAISDKLMYITLAWALGSLVALIPYALADRLYRQESDGDI